MTAHLEITTLYREIVLAQQCCDLDARQNQSQLSESRAKLPVKLTSDGKTNSRQS
jgi:hypothetical protein